MRVIGVQRGVPVAVADLGQGVDPLDALLSQGWATRRPLLARRADDGDLELLVEATPTAASEPVQREPIRERDARPQPGEHLVVRQRVAAYGVVIAGPGLLATEFSDRTSAAGRWGLPGGGIDDGEDPVAAVAREIYEETSQLVEVNELLDVQSAHWVGRAPDRGLEDFHAVRLIYRATCPDPSAPVVLDTGGTTADARWVGLDDVAAVPWTTGWHLVVDRALAASPRR